MPFSDVFTAVPGQIADIEAKLPTSTASLALAATAVSNADLGTGRIAKLDNLDISVSASRIPVPSTLQDVNRWGGTGVLAPPDHAGVESASDVRTGTGTTGWLTIKSVTGSGYITLALAALFNNGSITETDGRIRLVVDGNAVIQASALSLNSSGERGTSLVGVYDWKQSGGGGIACSHVPFLTSFSVQWYRAVSNASYDVTAKTWLQYFY